MDTKSRELLLAELLVDLLKLVQEAMSLVYEESEEEMLWKRKAVGLLNKTREVLND